MLRLYVCVALLYFSCCAATVRFRHVVTFTGAVLCHYAALRSVVLLRNAIMLS